MKSCRITLSYLLKWPFKYLLGSTPHQRGYNWLPNRGPLTSQPGELQVVFLGDLLGMGEEILEFSEELIDWIGSPDYLVFNLEAQVTDEFHLPLIKQSFKSSRFFHYLKSKFHRTQLVGGVANNHFGDFSVESRSKFFEELKDLGYVIKGQRQDSTLLLDDFLEVHFHTAWLDKSEGVAPLEELVLRPDGFHILFLHFGDEFSADPNPEMMNYVKALPKNVLAVVGHHTHRPSGIENFDGRVVAWSLGNISTPFGGHPVRWGQILKLNLTKGSSEWRVAKSSWSYTCCQKKNQKNLVTLSDNYPFQK